MKKILKIGILTAALAALLVNVTTCHAQARCPWLNAATAGWLLGGEAQVIVTAPTQQGDVTCDFTSGQASAISTLHIAVHTMGHHRAISRHFSRNALGRDFLSGQSARMLCNASRQLATAQVKRKSLRGYENGLLSLSFTEAELHPRLPKTACATRQETSPNRSRGASFECPISLKRDRLKYTTR